MRGRGGTHQLFLRRQAFFPLFCIPEERRLELPGCAPEPADQLVHERVGADLAIII